MDPSVLLDLQRMKSRSLRTASIEHDLTATLPSKQSDDHGNGWSQSNPLGIPQLPLVVELETNAMVIILEDLLLAFTCTVTLTQFI